MTEFDPTKPVQTRGGRAARVICTDMKSTTPVVAVVADVGSEEVWVYQADGHFNPYKESDLDLVNITTKHEGWVVVMPNVDGAYGYVNCRVYPTEADAISRLEGYMHSTGYRIARIEWED